MVSNKMEPLKPSVIREFFKFTADPTVISLAAGSPAPEALPVDAIQRMMREVIQEQPTAALQYSVSEGHPPLRAKLREYLAEYYGLIHGDDQVMVTTGAQQCMDLVAKVLCNEGDTVICEDPSFTGSLNCFRSYGAKLAGVPLEEDGINIEKLEAALKAPGRVAFIYLIPNFQNPSGITMSLEKRGAVYALAQRYDVAILEDNPYGDLRFAGEPIPAIKSMDTDGRVLYAGTFSKILSPGIREGYLVAPADIFGKLVVAKQCVDVHTCMLSQLLCLRFLAQTDMTAHLREMSAIYAHKCGLMLGEIAKSFPESVKWTRPEGGLFIWCTMPQGADGAKVSEQLALEKKVAVVPGGAFSVEGGTCANCYRLNFSTPTDENIVKGIAACAELMNEMFR